MDDKIEDKNEISLAEKTVEEKQNDIAKNRKTGFTTLLYRQMRWNFDVVLLVCTCLLFLFLGYCLAYINLAFAVEEIKLGIREFFEMVGAIIAAGAALMWKLSTPPGKWSQEMIRKANKKEEDLDNWGRTMIDRK